MSTPILTYRFSRAIKPLRIYLAGKVDHGERSEALSPGGPWRGHLYDREHVFTINSPLDLASLPQQERDRQIDQWLSVHFRPTNKTPDWLQYGGPVVTGCTHDCRSADCGFGVVGGCSSIGLIDQVTRAELIDLNTSLLKRADAVFAWIDAPDAFGTIAEIGMAHGRNTPVFVAIDARLPEAVRRDLWFVAGLADQVEECSDLSSAWRHFALWLALGRRRVPASWLK